jgi:hypothetical protein
MTPSRTLRTVLACSLFFAASAGHASPNDDLAQGQAAVINALVAGANVHAPTLLDSARRNLQVARDAIVRNEIERARRFARQAFDDATAAESRAHTVREAKLGKEPKAATR